MIRSFVTLSTMAMAGYLAHIHAMQAAALLNRIPSFPLIMDGRDPWLPYLTGAVAVFLSACAAWRFVLMPLLEHLPPWLLARMSKHRVVRRRQTADREGFMSIRFVLWHVTPKRNAWFAGTLGIVAVGVLALGYKLLTWQTRPVIPGVHPVLTAAALAALTGLAVRLAQGVLFLRGRTVLTIGPDAQWHFGGQSFDLWTSQYAVVDHDRAMSEDVREKWPEHKYHEAVQLAAYTPGRIDIAEFSDRREAEDSILALVEARRAVLEQHGMQPSFG